MKPLTIFKIILIVLAAVISGYCYLRNIYPLEIYNTTLHVILVALFAFSPAAIWITIGFFISEKYQENKILGCLLPGILIIHLLHNWAWAILLLTWGKSYEDVRISYPRPEDKKYVIVEQYIDEGALGSHSRTIEAYEVMPGVRWIVEVR
jgi:hypothetical protein